MSTESNLQLPSIATHQVFTVAEVRQENYRTKTFLFNENLPANPGQFVMLWLPELCERPFSIAGNSPFRMTVVTVGCMSEGINSMHVGDRMWVRGPLGQGFKIRGKRLLLVAGGYGIAPLLFLAKEAQKQGCEIDVVIGARTANDILLVHEFEKIGLLPRIVTDDGSLGAKGIATDMMEVSIREQSPDCVYACGPTKMLQAVEEKARLHQLPHQLSWEAVMRCGMGLCGSCELDHEEPYLGSSPTPAHHNSGWLVCMDGPVSFSE